MSAEEQNVEEAVPVATAGEEQTTGEVVEEGETTAEEQGGSRECLQLCALINQCTTAKTFAATDDGGEGKEGGGVSEAVVQEGEEGAGDEEATEDGGETKVEEPGEDGTVRDEREEPTEGAGETPEEGEAGTEAEKSIEEGEVSANVHVFETHSSVLHFCIWYFVDIPRVKRERRQWEMEKKKKYMKVRRWRRQKRLQLKRQQVMILPQL